MEIILNNLRIFIILCDKHFLGHMNQLQILQILIHLMFLILKFFYYYYLLNYLI